MESTSPLAHCKSSHTTLRILRERPASLARREDHVDIPSRRKIPVVLEELQRKVLLAAARSRLHIGDLEHLRDAELAELLQAAAVVGVHVGDCEAGLFELLHCSQ